MKTSSIFGMALGVASAYDQPYKSQMRSVEAHFPRQSGLNDMLSRRGFSLKGLVCATVFAGSPRFASASQNIDEELSKEDEKKKAQLLQQEIIKKKIQASKLNYRKADDLLAQRWQNAGAYSCVSETGSPCKDQPSKDSAKEQNGFLEDL